MYPHRIRLRGPWELETILQEGTGERRRVRMPASLRDAGFSGFAGQVRLVRKFGYPGRIDFFERVWLTFAEVKGTAEVLLNGQLLGANLTGAGEFDASAVLDTRNQLTVLLHADSDECGLTGEVALEIRCAVYLRDVNVSLSSAGDLVVRGQVVGEWPDPLDLYVLVDGANAHYDSLRASGENATFTAVIPVPSRGKMVRIDLAQGALIWYRQDVPFPVAPSPLAGEGLNNLTPVFDTISSMIVCLFDIDGTLLASGGAGKAALEAALTQEFGIALRGQIPYSGRTDRAIIRELFHVHAIEETPANLERIFAAYLRRLPACLQSHRGRVLPGVAELLLTLSRRDDVAIGLLTGNVRAGARAKLGHFGLYDHFSFGGFGDHHFDRDDVAREALAEVQRHVGSHVAGERIWVIGDTPLDVRCARAIGARVLAVATGVHTLEELAVTKPDLLLPDIADHSSLLERL